MKIVIDGRMADWSGIGRYTQELVAHLAKLDTANHYIILAQSEDLHLFSQLPPNFTVETVNVRPYGLKEQLVLPLMLYRLKPDLVHFVHFTAPCLYFGKRVITVHDLTLINYKTHREPGLARLKFELKYWAMRFVMRCSVMRSAAVITDTAQVRTEILAHYRHSIFHGGLKSRIHPIHLAASPVLAEPQPIEKFNLGSSPFLLYVGNYYPNKNISQLVESFKLLLPAKPNLKLVLVGREDYFLKKLMEEVDQKGLADNVVAVGRATDGELTTLYQKAALFVFPSLSEGFGLPPLEAMAQGAAVISSNASCMPEVLGQAAAYFDPTSATDMAEKISTLLDDPKELERLKKAGAERVKQFSWPKMAEQTLEVYQQVSGK